MPHGNRCICVVCERARNPQPELLTRREQFALAAMQGLCSGDSDAIVTSRNGQVPVTRYEAQAFMAEWAVDMADALLRALDQPSSEEGNAK